MRATWRRQSRTLSRAAKASASTLSGNVPDASARLNGKSGLSIAFQYWPRTVWKIVSLSGKWWYTFPVETPAGSACGRGRGRGGEGGGSQAGDRGGNVPHRTRPRREPEPARIAGEAERLKRHGADARSEEQTPHVVVRLHGGSVHGAAEEVEARREVDGALRLDRVHGETVVLHVYHPAVQGFEALDELAAHGVAIGGDGLGLV